MSNAKLSSQEATDNLKAYAEEHKAIAHRFFKSSWGRLQFLDSQLVDAVLVAGVVEGIPVLPVHDSFIVSSEKAFWLKDKVAQVYRAQMGFDAVIDWEPMPDMQEYLSVMLD